MTMGTIAIDLMAVAAAGVVISLVLGVAGWLYTLITGEEL